MRVAWLNVAGRMALAILFGVAGYHKIVDPEAFGWALYQYQLLPVTWISPVAVVLPWVELVAALALVCLPPFQRAAAWLMLGLLAVFALAMSITLWRGIDVACGCLSSSLDAGPLTWRDVGRNAIFMCVAFGVLTVRRIFPAAGDARAARDTRAASSRGNV